MIRTLQNAGPTLKIILGALLVIICAAMAITLIPGVVRRRVLGLSGPPAGVVATVGDEKVTVNEVQRHGASRCFSGNFRKGGPQMTMLLPMFSGQAAQQLINEKAMVAEARRLGLRTNDEELRDDLQHGPLAANFFPGRQIRWTGTVRGLHPAQRADD